MPYDRNELAHFIFVAMCNKANEIDPDSINVDSWDKDDEDGANGRAVFFAAADAVLALTILPN